MRADEERQAVPARSDARAQLPGPGWNEGQFQPRHAISGPVARAGRVEKAGTFRDAAPAGETYGHDRTELALSVHGPRDTHTSGKRWDNRRGRFHRRWM